MNTQLNDFKDDLEWGNIDEELENMEVTSYDFIIYPKNNKNKFIPISLFKTFDNSGYTDFELKFKEPDLDTINLKEENFNYDTLEEALCNMYDGVAQKSEFDGYSKSFIVEKKI